LPIFLPFQHAVSFFAHPATNKADDQSFSYIVDLSLVSDISSAKDERYTVKSVADGSVVGELRLAVSYQDIRLLPKDRYAVARVRLTLKSR
jgi:hypothetical protein